MRRWPRDQKSKPEVNSRDVIKWRSEAYVCMYVCKTIYTRRIHDMCVDLRLSVTLSDIWTKFGTEHKYHTINTPEWPNTHNPKIQDGGGRHHEFRKKVNNSGLDRHLHQILWEDAPRPRGNDHMTKSRNRKLILVTSSNKRLEHKCVNLSDCNRYLNQIWYRAQALHY